ncbi:MAG: DUF2148 domain-containing protein [Methanoregula sp.]|jgi:uncharacterized ferredoxin-like protein|uniref:ferredoxin domain-containing protein n=1 Tax=Methanoregula sp. TaxID=2052170 RepID=UPI003D12C8CB
MTVEKTAVTAVAGLMALAARTAPKARGQDAILVRVLITSELKELSGAMITYGETHENARFFLRDAENIAASDACVLVGVLGKQVVGINCGACGYASCTAFTKSAQGATAKKRPTPFDGPSCAVRMTDLGIALGSAVKTAQIHNVDNRIMYSAGSTAISLGLLGKDCTAAFAIPLSASGKNIFFDRDVAK